MPFKCISLATSCTGLWGEEPQTAYLICFTRASHIPYKHSTGGPPEGLQRPLRPATPWRPVTFYPWCGMEVGCKVGLRRTSGGLPSLSLLFYPLTLFFASCLSVSQGLASNSQPDASILPPPVAQPQLVAYCHRVASGGMPSLY